MTPSLIVTRPEPQGAVFVAGLSKQDVNVIMSPLIGILPVVVKSDLSSVRGVIFTSVNGVDQVARLNLPPDLCAWCVGEATAQAAAAQGLDVKIGPGDAAGLTEMIIAAKPPGPLAHIRGQHARGDVAATLTNRDLLCLDIIAYDQKAMPLTKKALTALNGSAPVILPVFSPRTVALLGCAGPYAAPLHVVAISDVVAHAAADLGAQSLVVAREASGHAMIDATIMCLQALKDYDGTGLSA